MRLMSLAAATLLLAASVPQAFAADIQPREVAAEVAKAVDERFFDVARARVIAEGLRKNAESGAYDKLSNPLDLATALSAYLQPFDGHFAVVYRPEAGPQDLPGLAGPRSMGPRAAPGADLPLARQNYGFARTEMLPGGIGYIAVKQFAMIDPRSPEDPARRAADAALQSVIGARALILDLRDSRGGAPAMVAYLASHFVPAKAEIFNTFHTRGAAGNEQRSEAPVVDPTGPRRLDLPLYILVNGGTGSASESLPYTLQAAKRAVVVGEPTNGRANPGGFMRLPQGFAVFVSGGSPRNPVTQGNWEGTGVLPDVAIPSAQALRRAQELALEKLIAAEPQGPAAAEWRWLLEDLQATPAALSPQALQAYAGSYGEGASIALGEDGALVLRQGRRAAALRPLAADVFVSVLDPVQRVQFEREGGRIVALTLRGPGGPMARYAKPRT